MCNKLKRRKCCNYKGCERSLGSSNRSGLCYYHYKVTYLKSKKDSEKGETLNTITILEIQND